MTLFDLHLKRWNPEAKYFQVGPIDKDQIEDYAQRSSKTLEEAERWLAPNRGY